MKTIVIAASLAVLASAFAFAGNSPQGDSDSGSQSSGCKQSGQAGQGSSSNKDRCYTDAQILERLHAGNLHEIAASKLALENSKDDDVLAFARMMIEMHSAADKNVLALASDKDVTLAAQPRPLDDAEKAEMESKEEALEELADLEGEEFDEAYAAHMIESHEMTLKKLDLFEKSTSDEALDALIEKTRPVVEAHLEEARDLAEDQEE